MEILSPAGSFEAAKAAIAGGCDAVYLGAKSFSARAGAKNFDDQQLKEVIYLCHSYGVRVHLALNTLISNREMSEALALAKKAYELGVDALIVQDLGLASLVHEHVPGLTLHGSTQMSVHSLQGVIALQKLGFSRAILARELSLKEIEEIVTNAPIETECFVHGALCMSVSGQCLMSAALGGRSGNRGRCAGTCRLPFSFDGKKDQYQLSLKDLCATQQIDQLEKIGVTSVKIEGRLKRADYVYQVTKSYYEAAKGIEPDQSLLAKLFSRSGFTQGYLLGDIDQTMFGVRQDSDVQNTRQTAIQMSPVKKTPLRLKFSLGESATLTAQDQNHTAFVTAPTQVGQNGGTPREKAVAALQKLGDTPYCLGQLDVWVDGVHTLPVSALNALRRQAIDQLIAQRVGEFLPIDKPLPQPILPRAKHTSPACLIGRFETVKQMGDLAAKFDFVMLPIFEVIKNIQRLSAIKQAIICELPRMCFDNEKSVLAAVETLKQQGFTQFEAQNIAQVPHCNRGGMALNAFNTYSVEALQKMGLSHVTLSAEMHHRQLSEIDSGAKTGMFAYGYLPLMVLRACPNKGAGGCKSCKKQKTLTDRKGKQFEIFCQGNYSYLLNSAPVYMGDKPQWCAGVDYQVLCFTSESSARAAKIIDLFEKKLPFDGEFTRGLYGRGVQNEKE